MSDSLVDLSANLDLNSVIFDFVDSSSSYLSNYIKTLNFSPHLLYDLIEFQKIPKKYINFPWIRPVFTTILFNS